jgi:hypothetical protein
VDQNEKLINIIIYIRKILFKTVKNSIQKFPRNMNVCVGPVGHICIFSYPGVPNPTHVQSIKWIHLPSPPNYFKSLWTKVLPLYNSKINMWKFYKFYPSVNSTSKSRVRIVIIWDNVTVLTQLLACLVLSHRAISSLLA